MNDEDVKLIAQIMAGLTHAMLNATQLQDSMWERIQGWDLAQSPPQSLQEWSSWHGFIQSEGHMMYSILGRFQTVVEEYHKAKAEGQGGGVEWSPN